MLLVCFFFVVLPSSTYSFTAGAEGSDFSLDHTQAHTTFGRTPMDDGSARRRDLYLTTQALYKTNIHAPGGIRTHDPNKRSAANLTPQTAWPLGSALLVCIRRYLKSVLRYKCLTLDTYHPDTLQEQRCEQPWLFFEAKTGPRGKTFWEQWSSGWIRLLQPPIMDGQQTLSIPFALRKNVGVVTLSSKTVREQVETRSTR
jgi:hypothetical protein